LLIPVLRLVVRLVVLERRWPGGRRPSGHLGAVRDTERR
jgi:hypothetical protein